MQKLRDVNPVVLKRYSLQDEFVRFAEGNKACAKRDKFLTLLCLGSVSERLLIE